MPCRWFTAPQWSKVFFFKGWGFDKDKLTMCVWNLQKPSDLASQSRRLKSLSVHRSTVTKFHLWQKTLPSLVLLHVYLEKRFHFYSKMENLYFTLIRCCFYFFQLRLLSLSRERKNGNYQTMWITLAWRQRRNVRVRRQARLLPHQLNDTFISVERGQIAIITLLRRVVNIRITYYKFLLHWVECSPSR